MDSRLNKLRDDLGKEIEATRNDLGKEIANGKKAFKEEIVASENRVVKGILEFITEHIMPVIDEGADKTDVERVERKLDSYIDKTLVLKSRVEEIESLPTVAHELRIKKDKNPKKLS